LSHFYQFVSKRSFYHDRLGTNTGKVATTKRLVQEHCDRLGGLMLLQSLAGGTGSGVGTYLTEKLRDDYPHANLLNHTVWPYESGEVIVQVRKRVSFPPLFIYQ
jgi:hypothetical protein